MGNWFEKLNLPEAGGSGGEVRGWKITSSSEGKEGLGLDGEWVGEE